MKRIFLILIAALCIACFALPVFGCAPSENDDGDGGDTMTEEEYQHYGAYSYYYYPQLGRDVMPGSAHGARLLLRTTAISAIRTISPTKIIKPWRKAG